MHYDSVERAWSVNGGEADHPYIYIYIYICMYVYTCVIYIYILYHIILYYIILYYIILSHVVFTCLACWFSQFSDLLFCFHSQKVSCIFVSLCVRT